MFGLIPLVEWAIDPGIDAFIFWPIGDELAQIERIQSPADWYGPNVASVGIIQVRAERGSGDIALAAGAKALV